MSKATPFPAPVSSATRRGRSCIWAAGTALFCIVLMLVIPFGPTIHRHPPRLHDHYLMKGLEIAVKGYQTEYNRFPPLSPDKAMLEKAMPSRGELLRILSGEHPALNPRGVRFLDPRRAKKRKNGLFTDEAGQPHLVDSSGNPFMVIWDADGDGTILNPAFGFRDEPPRVEASVLVFSAGPDGDYGTWKDNVTSWIIPP